MNWIASSRSANNSRSEWREGLSPRIEAYLDGGEPAVRDRLLRELILIEVELRMERGETPEAEEYLSEHPSWGSAVAEAFLRYSRNSDGQNDWVATPLQSQLLSPNSTEEEMSRAPSPDSCDRLGRRGGDGHRDVRTGRAPAGTVRPLSGAEAPGQGRIRQGLPRARRDPFAARGDQGAPPPASSGRPSRSSCSSRKPGSPHR